MKSTSRAVAHDGIGSELVREWIPEVEPRAIIVLLHGLFEHSGRYERTGDLLSNAGFHVRSFDAAGHGASGGARADIEDWDQFHDQLQDHMEWAYAQGPPVVLMGHSGGSLIAVGYCLEERHQPNLMVLSAPSFSGGARWQRVAAKLLVSITPRLRLPTKITGDQLVRDADVGGQYETDPLVQPKGTVRLGSRLFDAMDRAREGIGALEVPTLALHGGKDTLVPTESSAFLADHPKVERRVYPDLHHEILNEPEGPQVVADIIAWVNDRI